MGSSMILVCAVLASMAAGVLVAYGACYLVFTLFRIHARRIAVRSSAHLAVPRVAQS